MINKKWMVLALLIGNILLISITGANAMYGGAVLQRGLTKEMAAHFESSNTYPGLISVEATSSSKKSKTLESAEKVRSMPRAFGVDAIETVEYYFMNPSHAKADFERRSGMVKEISLGYMKDIEDHIEIVAGRMYADTPNEDGMIEVIVSENGLSGMKLTLNETFTMQNFVWEDKSKIQVKVVGVFRNSSEEDPYWVTPPSSLKRNCLMSGDIFMDLFFGDANESQPGADLHVLLDYTQMRGDRAVEYAETAEAYREYFKKINGQSYRDYFSSVMTKFQQTTKKVNTTLWVLQVPIFTLLGAFIFMVSRQMLDMEQNEIAVLKSRGASRVQIITAYLMQSTVLALIGIALGIPIGAYMVQVLGSANAFMGFVKRTALPIELNGRVLLFCGIASLFSIAAMVLPVFKHSTVTIVNHKQKKHRKSEAPLWQRLFLDVAVLAVSLYLLYNYNGQKDLLTQRVAEGASLDPMLFISSSVFMIGAGLFALRILPAITYLLYRVFKKLWSPALYAAFLQVIRTRYKQSFIMVFLIMTIALGVFNAQAARTINTNEEEDIRYSIGADIVLKERWAEAISPDDPMADPVPIEPDFTRYQMLDGAESVTKVLNDKSGRMTATGVTLDNVQIMGIHTKEFGETAWFKDDLFRSHFYDYLNAMSTNSRAVLVSRNMETTYGLKLGDKIVYHSAHGSEQGIIYGFVDYWPGYQPFTYGEVAGSPYTPTEHYLVVANFNQLQVSWEPTPYEVWIKAKDSTQFIYDFAEENKVYFTTFKDAAADTVAMKNDPVFQGTNGILTVGFIVVLLLCTVGFLIYWILSIKSRALQFGIYRAMGMSMREIITMLIIEHVFISGTALATGALVGHLTSKLYMPLIQIAYAAYDNSLPLKVISEQSDMVRLTVIVGVMIVICMVILGWLISKMKIAQALKLGED